MKKIIGKLKNWWWWNAEFVIPPILFMMFVIGMIYMLLFASANSIKYNCNLEKRPSIYMAFFINTDVHDYAPEKFCADVKERMAKG